MLKTISVAGALIVLALAQPAMAALTSNGKDINGVGINGKDINGKDINGKDINGKDINGTNMSGQAVRDPNADAPLSVIGIEFPARPMAK